jgi:hypothetical protein
MVIVCQGPNLPLASFLRTISAGFSEKIASVALPLAVYPIISEDGGFLTKCKLLTPPATETRFAFLIIIALTVRQAHAI